MTEMSPVCIRRDGLWWITLCLSRTNGSVSWPHYTEHTEHIASLNICEECLRGANHLLLR